MRLGAMYIAALKDGLRLPLLLMLPEVFRLCKALPALLRMVASMVRNACCIVKTFLETIAFAACPRQTHMLSRPPAP